MKKLFTVIVFFFLLNSVYSQCSSTFGFYTIKFTTSELCFIDTIGNVTIIGSTGIPLIGTTSYDGIEFDKNSNLWWLHNDTLYSVNINNGQARAVKIFTPNQVGGPGFSFNPSNELYVLHEVSSVPPGSLEKITDFISGTWTNIGGSTGVASILGIEFDDAGNLWAMDECCVNKLHQIDLITGQAIPNSFPTHGQDDPLDLDFSLGQLWGLSLPLGSSASPTTIFKINTTDGTTQSLFTLTDSYLGLAGGYLNPSTVYDTVYISVTDTLIIDAQLTGISPPNNINTLKVYPNPTKTHIFIDSGNLTTMNGYSVRIENTLGQTVFTSSINQQQFYIDLSSWSGNGTYFVYIIDPSLNYVSVKKIIIQ